MVTAALVNNSSMMYGCLLTVTQSITLFRMDPDTHLGASMAYEAPRCNTGSSVHLSRHQRTHHTEGASEHIPPTFGNRALPCNIEHIHLKAVIAK
jgi:hypothetical protein